jgi:Na+-driven multidrug efflux pump
VFGMTDVLVIDIAEELLLYLSVSGFFITVALSYTGGLQGSGDTRSPLYISILSQVVVPLGLCTIFEATVGLQARYIWMAILAGHVTRCALSVARFRQQKWRGICVDLDPPQPKLVTVEAELPGAEPHIPMHEAPPATRS